LDGWKLLALTFLPTNIRGASEGGDNFSMSNLPSFLAGVMVKFTL